MNDHKNQNIPFGQRVPDQAEYAAALAEDQRFMTLAETLRRAHVVAAQVRQQQRGAIHA